MSRQESQETLVMSMMQDIDLGDNKNNVTDIYLERKKKRLQKLTEFRSCERCGRENVPCCLNLPCGHVTVCMECRHLALRCTKCQRQIVRCQSLSEFLLQDSDK